MLPRALGCCEGSPPSEGCSQLRAPVPRVLIHQRRPFHGSVCKPGHPREGESALGAWDGQPSPQDNHANGLAGPCRALLIPARLGHGSWRCLGDALRKIRAPA